MDVRPLTTDGIPAATETIALAFRRDPVWGVALPVAEGRDDDLRSYWRLHVEGALRYDTVFAGTGLATVSVWIPPGGTELSDDQEVALRTLVEERFDPARAEALFELWRRFAENHPHDEPHAYLSLLATRPTDAGHGYGQAHLALDLARWDAAGVPTYLESSNPANDHRYERQGFFKVGEFETVLDHAVVSTMRRSVGG